MPRGVLGQDLILTVRIIFENHAIKSGKLFVQLLKNGGKNERKILKE